MATKIKLKDFAEQVSKVVKKAGKTAQTKSKKVKLDVGIPAFVSGEETELAPFTTKDRVMFKKGKKEIK